MFARVRPRFAALLLALFATTWLAAAPLRVGIDIDGEPMTFVDAKGVPSGFAVDVMNAIAHEMHFEVVYVAKPWAEMFSDFEAGRIDALANITSTPQRAAIMEFSDPHSVMNAAIFVRRGGVKVTRALDLANVRIATKPGGAPYVYLQAHGWAQHVVPAATLRDSLRLVAEGRADAVLDARIIGLKNIRDEHLDNLETADVELLDYAQRVHIGLQLGDTAHLGLINEGLARLHANGAYDRIYERWLEPLDPRRLRLRDVQPYLIILAAIAAAVLGALYWQRRLLQSLSRQAEALRLSEERLTLVLEGSEDGFWDWDMRTNLMQRSERWAAMLGYNLAEIAPTLDAGTALVHPDDRRAYEAFQARFTSGNANRYDLEYRMRTKDGRWRWVLDRGKVVARAPDGTPLRMAGTHTDITDRKLTEQALAENRELLARSAHLLAQTQAVAHIGGWEFDLRTQKLFWSEETFRLHETTPAEYQPSVESAIEFYTPASRAVIVAAFDTATRLGTPFDLELDVVTAKRRPIRIHTTGRAELQERRVVRLYGSFRDITDEKAAEEDRQKIHLKMLETQKLESLGVLAGGIAHDFNNLLTVVLANATFARETVTGAEAEPIVAIETAAHRAADLCRQMLAYAGQGNLQLEPLDLSDVVQDTARLLLVSISKKADLHTELTPGLPAVEGDPSQLRQVVMNLVINASEALGDAAGEIHLRTWLGRPAPAPGAIVHSFDLPAGDCVCLEVADTGAGMDSATLARVFDPFFTTKFTGRGLGLAATLGIVRTHRGALVVTSAPGRGSTFQFFLGAKSSAPAPEKASEPVKPPTVHGGVILLVDDEPSVLNSADVLLRTRGYQTVLATDGVEALEKFRANPTGFAAVLLDLTMPRLDGAEVLREIRTLNPAARVLVMSGFSEQDVRDRLRGLGPISFLHKPFSLHTLLTQLGEVIAG